MSNRNSNNNQSPIIAILGAIFVIVLVVLSQVTGVDFLGLFGFGGTVTPPPPTRVVVPVGTPGIVNPIQFENGLGASKDFWQVYFTIPVNSTDPSLYVGGIDGALASAIDDVNRTLDIAAFEWGNRVITDAVLRAHQRGVRVRLVADNEHTVEEDDSTISELADAGIPIVYDERSALMHNKFMIMDGTTVWTGSTNFTVNGVYRNNNNLLSIRARRAVETYQAEFDEMFTSGVFGPRGSIANNAAFQVDGVVVRVLFSPEDEVIDVLEGEIGAAADNVRFLAFSFTLDEVGDVLLEASDRGVNVEGVFETRGSETQFSEMPRLYCAGLDVRQDGNPRTMHHKVFIIDDTTVITGSFNFSDNATTSNDENMVIIYDPDLVQQYLGEYERVKAEGSRPDPADMNCS